MLPHLESTPLGPELRVYMNDRLLWSQVPRDGRDFGTFVAERRADYESRGWVASDRTP